MEEEMNQAEVAREETEQKMLYKFLVMIKDARNKGESMEELEKEVETLLKK